VLRNHSFLLIHLLTTCKSNAFEMKENNEWIPKHPGDLFAAVVASESPWNPTEAFFLTTSRLSLSDWNSICLKSNPTQHPETRDNVETQRHGCILVTFKVGFIISGFRFMKVPSLDLKVGNFLWKWWLNQVCFKNHKLSYNETSMKETFPCVWFRFNSLKVVAC